MNVLLKALSLYLYTAHYTIHSKLSDQFKKVSVYFKYMHQLASRDKQDSVKMMDAP